MAERRRSSFSIFKKPRTETNVSANNKLTINSRARCTTSRPDQTPTTVPLANDHEQSRFVNSRFEPLGRHRVNSAGMLLLTVYILYSASDSVF